MHFVPQFFLTSWPKTKSWKKNFLTVAIFYFSSEAAESMLIRQLVKNAERHIFYFKNNPLTTRPNTRRCLRSLGTNTINSAMTVILLNPTNTATLRWEHTGQLQSKIKSSRLLNSKMEMEEGKKCTSYLWRWGWHPLLQCRLVQSQK